jgi:hypothetical protein
MNNILTIFFLIFIFACQPIEKNKKIVFDNNQLPNFDILSKKIEIKTIFEKKISDPYIGHTLQTSLEQRVINWVNDNFKGRGDENIFKVTILEASLTKIKFENTNAKNFDEKINYKYELFYLIEFTLYDNFKNLLSSTLVETSRSTTSGLYISIQNKEKIIEDLIYLSLVDLSKESQRLLLKYLGEYII